MERTVADRRRWVLIDTAREGENALYIASTVSDLGLEMNRLTALVEQHGMIEEIELLSRKDRRIIFRSGGVVQFVLRDDVSKRTHGAKFAVATSTSALSYWDRRDVRTTGAHFI